MPEDKEQEIRIQFLAEAKEYLGSIESELLGLSNRNLQPKSLEATLRAAHSIKGGAAMMEFNTLSHFSHRLEDFFKVLNSGQLETINEDVEVLLLSSIDCLRKIIALSHHTSAIEQSWLEINVNPIFEQLHARLGEPEPEEELAVIPTDEEAEIKVLLFQTEVEEYLQRLESALQDSSGSSLSVELLSIAQELAGLSQMLKLNSLSSLCESVEQQVQTNPDDVEAIAKLALQEWRRVQNIVIAGQTEAIPTQLTLEQNSLVNQATTASPSVSAEPEPLTSSAQETLNWIASLESLTREEDKLATVNHSRKQSSESLLINQSNYSTDSEVTDNSIRVSVRHLDSLNELMGEYTFERNGMNLRLKRMRRSLNLLKQKIQLLNELRVLHRQEISDIYSPIPTANINTRIGAGNAIPTIEDFWGNNNDSSPINRDSFPSNPLSPEAITIIEQIEKITGDLHFNLEEAEFTANAFTRNSEMMQTKLNRIRMRPLAELVAPFPRALRNLELQYGKKAQLKIRGSSTLIDRTIIESLKDPLIQLVRNAFAHGIENPEIRKAKGKSAQGTISINAAYRGDRIAITVKDDGRGLDLEKIQTRARQLGLITPDSQGRNKRDLIQLIFQSGFSTAEELTDLAGRGVGMDVVKTNLEQIGGTIEVDTLPDVGTTFTIAVPFNLSVLRVLLVESNGMLLAFPSNVVEEMLIVEPQKIFTNGGQEFFNLEGSIVPLLRLAQCLQLPQSSELLARDEIPSINQPTVLMIAQGNELFGIQTDRYWREEEVTLRQVEGYLPLPGGFCGCTLLGDGQVVPLVDVLTLLKSSDEPNTVIPSQSKPLSSLSERPKKPNAANPAIGVASKLVANSNLPSRKDLQDQLTSVTSSITAQTSHKNSIMVIDDSLNSRRFLALTLENAGYQTEQAGDGQEALEKLAAGISVGAIICDLEMPRLDGFGFLSQVKSSAKYQHLPVIMLTSRSGIKHRQAAMNLGAMAYMNKPFQKQELWSILAKVNF